MATVTGAPGHAKGAGKQRSQRGQGAGSGRICGRPQSERIVVRLPLGGRK